VPVETTQPLKFSPQSRSGSSAQPPSTTSGTPLHLHRAGL